MTKLEKMIRGAIGGFEIVAAKRIVKKLINHLQAMLLGFKNIKHVKMLWLITLQIRSTIAFVF
jgi:hypothetical protein